MDDQLSTPLADALRAYGERDLAAFHTPGHKLGAGAPPALVEALGEAFLRADMGIANGVDDTQCSGGFLRRAEELAAAAWGGERAFFLVNGSSSGMHAALPALVGPGETVIVPRSAHRSLLTGLILSGAMPAYVEPERDLTWGVATNVRADRVREAVAAHPHARAVVVTSPSYNGFCCDVRSIAAAAHEAGLPLLVDQAWGAHLRFCSRLPEDAMSVGADAAVTSVHKLLSGLSQSSLLVACGERIDLERLRTMVGLTQTTSPLAPILASIDLARAQMVRSGEELWNRALDLAGEARRAIGAIPGLAVLGADVAEEAGFAFDPVRLTVSAAGRGLSGFELERRLRSMAGVTVEAADPGNVVVNITFGDSPESVGRLVAGLRCVVGATASGAPGDVAGGGGSGAGGAAGCLPPPPPGRQALTPREAFFARTRLVGLAEAVGRVSADLLIPYPPGIPVLGPGEVVPGELVAYVAEAKERGVTFHGPHDLTLQTLRVVVT